MRRKFAYNLYDTWDDNRLVLKNAALADVMEFTGLENIKISRYIETGSLICRRYRPEKAGFYNKNKKKQTNDNYGKFTPQMYREWTTMNERYGKKR